MNIWTTPLALEQKIANIISNQGKHGVNFNKAKAAFGVHILTEKIVNIDKELVPMLPPMMHKGTEYKAPFKANGQFKVFVERYAEKVGLSREEVGGPFTALWYTPFDPSKTDKMKHVMADAGWVPSEWNNKKNPIQELEGLGYLERQEAERKLLDNYIYKNILGHSPQWTTLMLRELKFRGERKISKLREHVRKARFWVTSPKINPDDDKFIGDSRIGELIQSRMVWSHRRSLIEGLIKLVRPDGKISADANSCATPTARMRHRGVVNIPAGGAAFGYWCRSLFQADEDKTVLKGTVHYKFGKEKDFDPEKLRRIPGTNNIQSFDGKKKKWEFAGHYRALSKRGHHVFVGYDGAGLELRMLAHYVGDENFTHQILEGDIHSHNQQLAGLPTRNNAKTFIYAFLYGAGDAKIGSIVGGTAADGAEIKARFMKSLPKLAALIEKVQKLAGSEGYIEAIDGRRLYLRRGFNGQYQTHKALNVLLQGAGAIVMKYAMAWLDTQIRKQGLRAYKVIDMHDEGQYSVHPDDVVAVRKLMEECVKWAGEFLKMNCPLASDSMVGANWYDTH